MGLLSRTKKTTPSLNPPPISGPVSQQPILPPVPGDYGGQYQSNSYGNGGYGGNDKYSSNGHLRADGGYSGALPSPPGSPVEAQGRGYPHHKPPSPSYQSASHPRPQQTHHNRNGNPVTPTSATFNTASSSTRRSNDLRDNLSHSHSSSSRPDTGNRTNPSSFSSEHSNVLYNDSVGGHSSPATVGSERDVQGRMESLGLNGSNGHPAKQKSVDRTSCQSVEMADGTNDNRGASSRPQQQQQQQQRPVASAAPAQQRAPPSASYPAAQQIAPQRQPVAASPASNMPRPMSSATNNSSVLSPTPSQASSIARRTSSRYNLSDFTFIRTLGTGSFGRVHLVRSQHNSRSYAVKVLSKERVVKMKQVEHTNSEREMLERVRHPFLVNLWGTFKDAKNLYMVMDFVAGGELFSLLRKSQRFPDPVAKFFAAEVALALDYLHSLDIIYRDLKPENILLGADGHVKITDFGFAKHVPDITWTLCGTPDYLAPEIVQSRGYNKSVDWYALGVLMFEMLAGYPPFFTEDANPMRLYEKIIAGKVRYPSYFVPDAKDLLKSLLTPDLTKRFGNLAAGSRDIFGHSWFQEVDWERLYRKEIPAPYMPKVDGDWDASNFDNYPENDLTEYGSTGPDPHGHLFTAF